MVISLCCCTAGSPTEDTSQVTRMRRGRSPRLGFDLEFRLRRLCCFSDPMSNLG